MEEDVRFSPLLHFLSIIMTFFMVNAWFRENFDKFSQVSKTRYNQKTVKKSHHDDRIPGYVVNSLKDIDFILDGRPVLDKQNIPLSS